MHVALFSGCFPDHLSAEKVAVLHLEQQVYFFSDTTVNVEPTSEDLALQLVGQRRSDQSRRERFRYTGRRRTR